MRRIASSRIYTCNKRSCLWYSYALDIPITTDKQLMCYLYHLSVFKKKMNLVFHNRENKHDFARNETGTWHWCAFGQDFPGFTTGSSAILQPEWVGFAGFSKVVATLSRVGGSFNLFYGHHQGYLNNPIFSNLGLCAACWAHLMCHHELWLTSVSHPFSSLNGSLGLTGGKHYQKITIPIFWLILYIFPGCFSYVLFSHYLFSLLSSGWFVIAVCVSVSVRVRAIVNWCRVAVFSDK